MGTATNNKKIEKCMNSREVVMSRACDWREKHVIIVEETLEKGKK